MAALRGGGVGGGRKGGGHLVRAMSRHPMPTSVLEWPARARLLEEAHSYAMSSFIASRIVPSANARCAKAGRDRLSFDWSQFPPQT